MNWVLERVFNYCDDILSCRINACIKHKWAVQRFLNDYEDCQNDDSLFYFDEDVAEDFYWWAREFKHVEGVLAGEHVVVGGTTMSRLYELGNYAVIREGKILLKNGRNYYAELIDMSIIKGYKEVFE